MPNTHRFIEIFHDAKARPAGVEREQFLAEACRDDAELLERVRKLLHSHENAGDFLNTPLEPGPELEAELARLKPEEAGDRIGLYILREQIGEGGFGVVWIADQQLPVRRAVALKIIKLGMDTREVVARFEQERQALAMMDHPNIARVFDAGATAHGRPYFVMELVRGIKITDYCDQANLPPTERLQLFIQVCQAVQHAHQKGVIHRDLKPSNILVTLHDGVAVPKVIDFGVAKATQGRIVELTIYTQFQQMIGTPLYMSPEQAEMSGLDVDTRTDIYALGVLLYELLTGRTPVDAETLMKAGFDELRRLIREEDPPTPSTALDTMPHATLTAVARHRGSEPPELARLVRGDLDWIVMKALEKDRRRRYETASAFAADVTRYLADEPVSACPPSAMYRFHKFARRNRGALALAFFAGLAVVLALVGLAVSNFLILREKNEKVAALDQAGVNERKAKANELLARRRYYAAQMNLAMQAWKVGEVPRVVELLEGQRPKPEEEDLRGFEWFYLWRLCHSGNRIPIRGHDRAALGLAFSPDGKTLASASWDLTVRLWDTATGKELTALRCKKGPWEVAFSPDGKILASSGQEAGAMILWEVATGKPLHTIAGSVLSPRFTADGRTVVGSQADGKRHDFKEWNVASGETRATIPDTGAFVGLSTEQGTLITMADQHGPAGEIRIWEWPSGKRRRTIPTKITAAASSSDASRVATSTWGAINLWDTKTGDLLLTLPTEGFARGLAFSPDGKRLASGFENRRVTVWDLETGHRIAEDVHLDPVWGMAFSPDGKSLASSTLAGVVNLWDMTPAEEAATIQDVQAIPGGAPVTHHSLRFTPDGSALLVGHRGLTKVIDVATGKEIAVLPPSGIGSISADGSVLAGRAADSGFDIWDLRAGRKLPRVEYPQTADVSPSALLSQDGSMLAGYRVLRGENSVNVWNLATQQSKILKVPIPESSRLSVRCIDFSPKGNLLAAGYMFQWVTVWDVATGAVKLQFGQQPGMMIVFSVAFSPDGKSLAVGTNIGTVTLWDVEAGRQLVAFRGHTTGVNAIAFSPDGGTLATGGNDKTVRLWDTVTGQERGTLIGHARPVTNVLFSPDGFTIATASQDATVKLWRGATDALALAPRSAVPRLEHARSLRPSPGAFQLTAEGLCEAAVGWPREPDPRMQLARPLVSSEWEADASPSPVHTTQPSPDDYEGHRNRFAILRDAGKFSEAETALREAMRLRPGMDSLHRSLGELLAHQKKLPEALAEYREAVRLNPSSHDARAKVARTLLEQGDFAEAEREFRESIRLRPDHYDDHYGLGRALMSQKKDGEAVSSLREAIRLNPSQAGPRADLGWLHMRLQQFPQAEAEFREQIRLSPPDTPSGFYGLGKALEKQGKHAESIVPLRDLIRVDPGNHQARATLGWAFLLTGEPAKAEAEFREMIRLKPALAMGHSYLGRALVEQRKHAEAEAELREAIRLEPANSEAPKWLRRALEGQGKPADEKTE